MNKLFYFLIYQISRLPFCILYFFSNIIFLILYRLVRYRRKIVFNNIKKSFPGKNEKEIKQVEKQFYRNFSEYLVETLKSFSISQEELNKRHTYSNVSVFKEIKSEQKDVIMMCGHVFNWEWFIGATKCLASKENIAVYHKIHNPFWNDKINAMRSRFGTQAVEMRDIMRYMMRSKNDGDVTYLFIADQSPMKGTAKYYIDFLNQRTAVFNGFDKIAVRKDLGIVYCNTVKQKRGYYHTTFERIYPREDKFMENEVVHSFFERLEGTLERNPDNWLWSHRRWK